MTTEQLRRALVEQGFTEAAAMVEADVERQAEEEAEGGEVIDMTLLGRPASGKTSTTDFDEAA